MSGFDPHDPEIELMMARRAQAQGEVVSAGHGINFDPDRMRAIAHNADVIDDDDRVPVPERGSDWSFHAFGMPVFVSPFAGYDVQFVFLDDLTDLFQDALDRAYDRWKDVQFTGLSGFTSPPATPLEDFDVVVPEPGELLDHVTKEKLVEVYDFTRSKVPREAKMTAPATVNRAPCSKHGTALCGRCR